MTSPVTEVEQRSTLKDRANIALINGLGVQPHDLVEVLDLLRRRYSEEMIAEPLDDGQAKLEEIFDSMLHEVVQENEEVLEFEYVHAEA